MSAADDDKPLTESTDKDAPTPEAAAAGGSDGSKVDTSEIRSKVEAEQSDAKTKTWQNIKMRTKMSILQVDSLATTILYKTLLLWTTFWRSA